jgi:hypothetical protein
MIARYQGVVLVHLAKAAVRSTKSDSPFRQYDGPLTLALTPTLALKASFRSQEE